MHNRKKTLIIFLIVFLTLASSVGASEYSQYPSNYPDSPSNMWQTHDGMWQTHDGLWMNTFSGVSVSSSQSTGGPDDFGYTWNDTEPYSWIDASGGTDTGINNVVVSSGPIDIGFPFKFYENAYSQLYVSRNGYLSFNDVDLNYTQSSLPHIDEPNDVIAPFWVPITAISGYVRYIQGGSAPTRWLAVEWNGMMSTASNYTSEYTFEVILHENGDIIFQYGYMNIGNRSYCMASGIEDAFGIDGFEVIDFCASNDVNSYSATRITRPAPSARVSVVPLYQGRFARGGKLEIFEISIRNTGEFGNDVYDLTISSSSSWITSLYNDQGTLLTDTDSDGVIDTGSVAVGYFITIYAHVQPSAMVNIGDSGLYSIDITSSNDPAKSKTAHLHITVPAPFAQIFNDSSISGVSTFFVQPQMQTIKTFDQLGGNHNICEIQNVGFVEAWISYEYYPNPDQIEYAVLNHDGQLIRGVTQLSNHIDFGSIYDLAIDVTPSGYIGIGWNFERTIGGGVENSNHYFAILDAAGNVTHGPHSLTNNDKWGGSVDNDVPHYSNLRLTATDDNRFVYAWLNSEQRSNIGYDDVQYSIYDTNGTLVKDITTVTSNTNLPYTPSLASITGNRFLLQYHYYYTAKYIVLDSAGNIVKGETSFDTYYYTYNPAAAQLSGGAVLLAWRNSYNYIQYAVLDAVNYNIVAGPTTLINPAASGDEDNVSVSADANNHGILTWDDSSHLFYTLVDEIGNQISPPVVYRSPIEPGDRIHVNSDGYSNTSYTLESTDDVDTQVASLPLHANKPGVTTTVNIDIENYGLASATSVALTGTLDSQLTYVSAWPDPDQVISPTLQALSNNTNVVWQLSDLHFLGGGVVKLSVKVPQGEENIGNRYPITFTLTADGTDTFPQNNTFITEIMPARQVHLPCILRSY